MNNKPPYHLSEQELATLSAYVRGELREAEREDLEARLAADAELRRKLEEVRALIIGVREAGLAGRLDEYHETFPDAKSIGKTPRKPPATMYGMWWAAAAVILVVISIGLLVWNQSAEERLFSRYYQPDPGLPTMMALSDNYTFDKAMVDYKMGDYKAAVKAWNMLQSQHANDTLAYSLASAYLADGQAAQAKPLLEGVAAHKGSAFQQDACWYLGLILLREDNHTAARTMLEQSAHERKQELLKSLEER